MDEDDSDYAIALQLQEEYDRENAYQPPKNVNNNFHEAAHRVVDNALELTDPTPDIHALFQQFAEIYFQSKLGKVEVRWSPRMTLCAGLCCYEGHGGLCSIRLSKPLLALRPRKDTVQTLLHEMIHAYLFVTNNNKDHDAHGPEFLSHMNRINKLSGANITVYHSFHDEVNSFRTHWWQCDGPCRRRQPYYGLVKRCMNRAPSPRDTWWAEHQSSCGGNFTKIKEPPPGKKSSSKGGTIINKPKTDAKTISSCAGFTRTDKPVVKSGPPPPLSSDEATSGDRFVPFSGTGHRLMSPSASSSSKTSGPRIARPIEAFFKRIKTAKRSRVEDIDRDVIEIAADSDPSVIETMVTCPICASKIVSRLINDHLDRCIT